MSNEVIYKYPFRYTQSTITLPYGAKVMSVGIQNGRDMVLWAIVNPANDPSERGIRVLMTGEPFDYDELDGYRFVGTVTNCDGLVFHVFVELKQ